MESRVRSLGGLREGCGPGCGGVSAPGLDSQTRKPWKRTGAGAPAGAPNLQRRPLRGGGAPAAASPPPPTAAQARPSRLSLRWRWDSARRTRQAEVSSALLRAARPHPALSGLRRPPPLPASPAPSPGVPRTWEVLSQGGSRRWSLQLQRPGHLWAEGSQDTARTPSTKPHRPRPSQFTPRVWGKEVGNRGPAREGGPETLVQWGREAGLTSLPRPQPGRPLSWPQPRGRWRGRAWGAGKH